MLTRRVVVASLAEFRPRRVSPRSAVLIHAYARLARRMRPSPLSDFALHRGSISRLYSASQSRCKGKNENGQKKKSGVGKGANGALLSNPLSPHTFLASATVHVVERSHAILIPPPSSALLLSSPPLPLSLSLISVLSLSFRSSSSCILPKTTNPAVCFFPRFSLPLH